MAPNATPVCKQPAARSETEQLLMDIGLLDDPCAKKETEKKSAPAKKANPTPIQNNEKSRQARYGLGQVTLMSSKERVNALHAGDAKGKWNPVVGWAHVRGTHVAKAPSMKPAAITDQGGDTATAKNGTPDRAGSKPSRPAGKAAPKQAYVQPSATFVQPRQPSVAAPMKLTSAQDKYENWFGDLAKL